MKTVVKFEKKDLEKIVKDAVGDRKVLAVRWYYWEGNQRDPATIECEVEVES